MTLCGSLTLEELCDKLGEGVEIDDATVGIWYAGDGEIAETLEKEED